MHTLKGRMFYKIIIPILVLGIGLTGVSIVSEVCAVIR